MAISTEAFLLVVTIALIYFFVYRQNKLIGSLMLFLTSLTTLYLVDIKYAIIMIAITFSVMIYNVLTGMFTNPIRRRA